METIVNKVAESGIITLDLVHWLPKEEVILFDLKPFLFREMILREKDYRTALPLHDWAQYAGKHVAIHCTTDAIIPAWAYMLAATWLQPIAASVYFGTTDELTKHLITEAINHIDTAEYTDKRVVIKGCGDTPIPDAAFTAMTVRLLPVVKSLMYGEPCSTVPVYKRK